MFKFTFYSLLVLVVVASSSSHATDKHLICKQVSDIFTSTQIAQPQRTQGTPGKRGAPGVMGPPGPQGPRGPSGIVDYEQVNSTIDDKVQPVINGLCELEKNTDVKLDEISNKLDEVLVTIKSSIEEMKETLPLEILKQRGLCDIRYNNSCFFAIVHWNYDITYSQAETACDNIGSRVADIYSEEHYNIAMEYLGSKIPYTRSINDAWIGLKINPSTTVVTLRNRQTAPFLKWYPGRPSSSSSYTAIYLQVRTPRSTREGMANYSEDVKLNAVLCEISQ